MLHAGRLALGSCLSAALWIAVVGCDHDAEQCGCGASGQFSATIALACPAPSASIVAMGPCSASQSSPGFVLVTAGDAGGTCQVEVTAAGGSTVSESFQVTSDWLPCGSDPHGCGLALLVTPGLVDAGMPCDGPRRKLERRTDRGPSCGCYLPRVSSHTLRAIADLTRREQMLAVARARHAGRDVPDAPDKLEAIDAATGALRDAGVAYTLIGGVAVGIRSGVPRATLDVNFAIVTTADREATTAAFASRGFRRTGVFAHSMNFVHPGGEPVQLAFDPEFDPMIARAETVRFGQLELRVVTRDDLLAMKRRADADPQRRRSKALRDQADIALLEGDVPEPGEGW
jgi:hypothetical protein